MSTCKNLRNCPCVDNNPGSFLNSIPCPHKHLYKHQDKEAKMKKIAVVQSYMKDIRQAERANGRVTAPCDGSD